MNFKNQLLSKNLQNNGQLTANETGNIKYRVGDQCVAPHNNIKSDAYTPVNTVMIKNIWENERR